MTLRIQASRLEAYLSALFHTRGVEQADAGRIARALVLTSLRAVDTHGIRLAPKYLQRLDAGESQARPEIKVEHISSSLMLLDAGRALGHVAGLKAADYAVELARSHGLGVVWVRNSSHFGAASCYTLRVTANQMIGFCATNSDALVAPFNGKASFFGTNPIAVAAPGEGDEVFSLDMATSQSAFSRLALFEATGKPLEPGWAIDSEGNETRDPKKAAALLPLGGYKGTGLAMAVQILTALLVEGSFDHELAHVLGVTQREPQDVSHVIGALDISKFVKPERFRSRLTALLRTLRMVMPSDDQSVLAPGDRELVAFRERSRDGIPVTSELLEEMRFLAPDLKPDLF